MNARAGFAERLIAADMARRDGSIDAAAIEKLRRMIGDVARLAHEAEQLAQAVPTAGINPIHFAATRSQMGMAWHESDLAAARLPAELLP